MKIKIFLFLILILSSESKAWDTTAAKFYPLSVGNLYVFNKIDLWFNCNFHEVQRIYRVQIIDYVVKPNGKSYYKFSGWWHLFPPFWTYQRIDSTSMNVYAYDSTTNSEILLDSLSGNVNTYFRCQRLNHVTPFGWFERIDTIVIFNSLRVKRQSQCSGPIIAGIYYYLVGGIGFTGYSICELGTGEEYQLKGAIISGNIFGDTTLTSINTISESNPDKFSLSQNYPNPFNPNTIINYQCSMFNHISIKVYDALGNEVAILVNENKAPGNYSVQFDGSSLSSGIYFYKLQTDNFSETKTMTLLK